jgi:hypothetical protein
MRYVSKAWVVLLIILFLGGTMTAMAQNHILGMKFFDTLQTGVFNANDDYGLPGWTIQLYQNGVLLDTVQTDDAGEYVFPDSLPPGYYTVVEVLQPGYTNTTPASQTVLVLAHDYPNIMTGITDALAQMILPSNHIAFVDESRWGLNGAPGEYELDINVPGTGVVDQDRFTWPNNGDVPFTITYDQPSNTVTYIVGSKTLTWAGPSRPFSGFLVRAASVTPGSRMAVKNMVLTVGANNYPIPDVSAEYNGAAVYNNIYVQANRLTGSEISNGFTLTGVQNMLWDPANKPLRSRLACQFKFGTPVLPNFNNTTFVGFGNWKPQETHDPTYRQTVDDTLTSSACNFACTNETGIFAYPALSYGGAFPCMPAITPCVISSPISSGIIAGDTFSPILTQVPDGSIKKQLSFTPFAGCTIGGPATVAYGFPVIAQSGQSTAFNSASVSAIDNESLDFDFLDFAKINPVTLGKTLLEIYLL